MNWPLTAVVATTTNGTSKSNLLFIACLASPPSLSLSLCLSSSLTQLFIYTRTRTRAWPRQPHNLSLTSFFTSRPLNCANYALTASSSVWTGPLRSGLPLSKWQHVRAQLAIVVADGAQICHAAVCQLWLHPHPQPPSTTHNEAYKRNWVFCQETKSAIENECDKLKLSVERLENILHDC